jgi:cellulose synthase/poly-beta-1,6-N-acetylglucosamine synthase-like glycosyltransferase
VLVAMEISAPLMAEFADELEADRWNVERLIVADPNPAALVTAALPAVATAYVFRLDSDTVIGDDVAAAVAAADIAGADLCSIKCAVGNRTNVVTKLQALEYRMAMLSRHFRPWLTSGACFIGKTASLRLIFDHHSLWTPGEDIETGRAALALKLKIRHADFVVTTDVPQTWPTLIKQRRLWWAGTFRHWFINADRNVLHLPVKTGYMLLVVLASVYFKWWTMIDLSLLPYQLPLLLATYVVVTFVSNFQVRSRWMIVFPLYALVQSMVMPLLGALYYVVLAREKGRLGRYQFRYRRGLPVVAPAPVVPG